MPPTANFTIENINKTKAIIFGSSNTTGITDDATSNIYIIDVIKNIVVGYYIN